MIEMLISFLFEALPPSLGRPFEDTFENGKCTVEKNWAMVNWTAWCMWLCIHSCDFACESQRNWTSVLLSQQCWPDPDQFPVSLCQITEIGKPDRQRGIRTSFGPVQHWPSSMQWDKYAESERRKKRDKETERQIGEMAGKCFFHLLVRCCHK